MRVGERKIKKGEVFAQRRLDLVTDSCGGGSRSGTAQFRPDTWPHVRCSKLLRGMGCLV